MCYLKGNCVHGKRPVVIECFDYDGFHGCPSQCALALVPLEDGRTVVIATELVDNSGTSVTNIAELLASAVCARFGIEPEKLVWVEHYGYSTPTSRERTFDLVTFQRRIASNNCFLFAEPHWRLMTDEDWRRLGLAPRPPVRYVTRRY